MRNLVAAVVLIALGVYVRDTLLPYILLGAGCGWVLGGARPARTPTTGVQA